jgi:hypothetical protein
MLPSGAQPIAIGGTWSGVCPNGRRARTGGMIESVIGPPWLFREIDG